MLPKLRMDSDDDSDEGVLCMKVMPVTARKKKKIAAMAAASSKVQAVQT